MSKAWRFVLISQATLLFFAMVCSFLVNYLQQNIDTLMLCLLIYFSFLWICLTALYRVTIGFMRRDRTGAKLKLREAEGVNLEDGSNNIC